MTSQRIVGGKWRILNKIGSGSFGDIYEGECITTKRKVGLKVESIETRYPQLLEEYAVYRQLMSTPQQGIPRVHWCGRAGHCNVMVMDLLGPNLEMLYNKCNRKFSLKTVIMLAIQLLRLIEHHHKHSYLHRDIKPDNFLMGHLGGREAHLLHIIDMGLCKRYRGKDGKHIEYREKKKLVGTPRYASINTHQGIEQCRRDDLESIGYMLMYFNLGKLPWQGTKAKTKAEKYEKIRSKKIKTSVDELCRGFPGEFAELLHYSKSLGFTDEPDYSYLRKLFIDLYKRKGYPDDYIYDWDKLRLEKATRKKRSKRRSKAEGDGVREDNDNSTAVATSGAPAASSSSRVFVPRTVRSSLRPSARGSSKAPDSRQRMSVASAEHGPGAGQVEQAAGKRKLPVDSSAELPAAAASLSLYSAGSPTGLGTKKSRVQNYPAIADGNDPSIFEFQGGKDSQDGQGGGRPQQSIKQGLQPANQPSPSPYLRQQHQQPHAGNGAQASSLAMLSPPAERTRPAQQDSSSAAAVGSAEAGQDNRKQLRAQSRELLEAYEMMEADRDAWRRRCSEYQKNEETLKTFIRRLQAHISEYCPPLPE